MPYGVTTDGFVDKPIEDIITEIETELKNTIGAGFNVASQSPAGQIIGVFADRLRENWEVLQAAYDSFDPDKATGVSLTRLAALTGTARRAATKSTVTGRLNLDAGTTVPAGSIASVSGNPDARFVTLVAATNSGGSPADFNVSMEAETTGPIEANAGTLTVIETSVTGWNSITNDADATLGQDVEDDEDLRVRREQELSAAGAGTFAAVRSDLLSVAGVTEVTLYENDTNAIDADGLPPHSFEAVISGGTASDIAQAMWNSKPLGIETHGDTSGTATDVQGDTHTMYYTIPTNKAVYLDVFITINSDANEGAVYPPDGDTQVKNALDAFFDTLGVGDDVILSQLYPIIFAIDGVIDVTSIEADFSASPIATANLPIGNRELATLDTSNVTVTTA